MSSTLVITRLKQTFPALKYRNFRYFWFGQCISLIGTWMQLTAQQWLVYTMTKSALLLGFLGVAQFGPVMCLSLFAGVIVDKYPKKWIIIFTQTTSMIQALVLGVLVWSGHIVYWEILVLASLLGLANTLDMPARQSFMPELVERKDLRSAIGLNMAVFNSARIIGPAFSALLMARFGAGLLFLLNGISFMPVISFLYRINSNFVVIKRVEKKVLTEILEGLNHIRQSTIMLSTVFSMLAFSTFVMSYNIIIPLYAAEVLKQGVRGYGLLLSASGVGSLVAALLIASKGNGKPKFQMLFASALIASTLLVMLNFIHSLVLAVGLLTIFGFFTLIFMNTANFTLQLNSSDQYRGRVMSIYALAFMGTTPIGNIFAGIITEKFGSSMGFLICGVLTGFFIILIAISFVLMKRRDKREILETGAER